MLETLISHPSLLALAKEIQKGSSLVIEHLWEAPLALVAKIAKEARGKSLLLVSSKQDDRLLDSLSFFGETPLTFPSWEILPGEGVPPSPDLSGRRLEILYNLAKAEKPVILHTTVQSLMQKTVSRQTLLPLCHLLRQGQELSFLALPELLLSLGYKRTPVVSDKGEFAVRGGILDLFPLSSAHPYRLDFFGDTLEEIRTFDPVGQQSVHKVKEFFLCPASEWELLKGEKKPQSLLDALGKDALILLIDPLAIEDAFVSLSSLPGIDKRLLFSLSDLTKELSKHPTLFSLQQKAEELGETTLTQRTGRAFYSGKNPFQPLTFSCFDHTFSSHRWHHPFSDLSTYFSRYNNEAASTLEEVLTGLGSHLRATTTPLEINFIVSGPQEEAVLREKAEALQVPLPLSTSFLTGYLPSSFVVQDSVACLSMAELTQRYKIRREGWRSTYHTPSCDFHQLAPGDAIVHLHSGIGRFLGITLRPNHLGQETEFLKLAYAEDSLLYVPVSQSHLVSRYIGTGEEKPPLHTLGTTKWQKTCKQAEESITGYANQLLEKIAERVMVGGFRFAEDSLEVQRFEEEFPFIETEDQLRAIEAIKKDMCSDKSMDRLVCGDVGYGKTEVAMRAAFKAVLDGRKQVAVLVPTTVLAMQHYDTFSQRMANFPVRIAVLSRFCPPKQAKQILDLTKKGVIDILIGTHRLLSQDLTFKDLGLLIIDEEQKFGVRAKEKLRALKAGVDCLTLSATPIPRTLHLSLIGAREISEINTPPQDRLPIKSILAEKENSLIQHALLREFARDGQAIFVHNRVESLDRIAEDLQKLVPEAKIIKGHGQMSTDELDDVFHAFKKGQADLLVATTIVESGIDIPNVNTIFIDRADQFGMADLYQLRGRVGRWNRPAFAYFLLPQQKMLAEPAQKRLQSLVESSGHGGGLKLALRDLEIRGAGDILGVKQSGQVSAIGFHLYCKLLRKAIDALKRKEPIRFWETKMEVSFGIELPNDYINESSLRMELYYRLGNADSSDEVDAIGKEIEDRFGKMPRAAILLLLFTKIKIAASALQIALLKFDQRTFTAEKKVGKKTVKHTFVLPNLKNPSQFESEVVSLLKTWRPRL